MFFNLSAGGWVAEYHRGRAEKFGWRDETCNWRAEEWNWGC